ncbi:ankyrin repeat domain-containing protein SOWAHD [Sceloporus undulatus]|uniref:ankyrin repeat domain-containing protein SOWAHD n=1 Tax=Sceloporus undulatus TaxID=8520 RepID=UPI001C4CA3A5|nr:ankyrin repeat domain-containing protein SOWAHD [Sceloporus undulatus]XP_042334484.1 ankyrin repeat domain-containing protein SOWAHD [Sceloporus undulatus]XP_042334485.1 ankyrin repeat domain-containing protein SOWAHD [Sceloporus undulatus]XP_042334486.1 ankyrin repeat domain-containing protein SOWAHD [Sceloporus undulatus]
MAEKRKEESLQEGQLKMSNDLAQEAAFKAQMKDTVGSQSPSPSIRAGSLILHRGQLSNFNRSLSRASRRSGNWTAGMDTARLSMGWGSTRRKGLKEILLQTSQVKPTWLTASQRDSISVDVPEDQGHLDVNSEDLSLALDPLEHEWMLTVAQGDAENILNLLAKDPSLLSRRDFVTGFTVLHWLAKHGRHEDLIEVITFAEKNHYPIDINMFTASGRLTPLHLAALQGHEMVIKVLVGAYGANTSLRDHNGRKAWQYLQADASRELKELSGASEEDLAVEGGGNTNNNCAPSKRSGIINVLKGDYKEASGGRQSQRASTGLSYFRNMFRQAVAFFQEF